MNQQIQYSLSCFSKKNVYILIWLNKVYVHLFRERKYMFMHEEWYCLCEHPRVHLQVTYSFSSVIYLGLIIIFIFGLGIPRIFCQSATLFFPKVSNISTSFTTVIFQFLKLSDTSRSERCLRKCFKAVAALSDGGERQEFKRAAYSARTLESGSLKT